MVRPHRCATAQHDGCVSSRVSTEHCCTTAAIKDTLDRKGLLNQLQVSNNLQHGFSCMPRWSRPVIELSCSIEGVPCICFCMQSDT
jgi:hypothetical protein